MSFPIRQFVLDPTGRSPANYVRGAEYTLGTSRGAFHAIAPYYGPFYNDLQTWTVRKNGVALDYGTDYFGVLMCADDTMKFNGEVCEVFLIKGGTEGDIITTDMQVVGGLYQNHVKGLEDLWNAFINDERPLDWIHVMNKPVAYTPSYHLHMMNDVVGWQPVIVALERLANAVTLSNIPAFEELIDWVIKRAPEVVTVPEIDAMDPVDKMLSFSRLLYAMKTLNFNAVTFRADSDILRPKELFYARISSTNYPRQKVLYWDILHETTNGTMFSQDRGAVHVLDNEGFFIVEVSPVAEGRDEAFFRITLREGSNFGPIIAETKQLRLEFNPIWDWDYGAVDKGTGGLLHSDITTLATCSPETRLTVPGENFWKGI